MVLEKAPVSGMLHQPAGYLGYTPAGQQHQQASNKIDNTQDEYQPDHP